MNSIEIIIKIDQQLSMQTLLSPQNSHSSRPELFKQRSPSFRTKRIPSLQDPYIYSSNQNLKVCKPDSPSSEIKRRKSQYVESNQGSSSGQKRRQKTGNSVQIANTQNIISSIQDLKEEYQTLREAYKALIQERLQNSQEMNRLKIQNSQLKQQLEEQLKKQEAIMQENIKLKSEVQEKSRKLEEFQRKEKQIETDLYFLAERQKSKTQNLIMGNPDILLSKNDLSFSKDLSSDQPDIEEIPLHTNINESNILSFSLTSAVDQSLQLHNLHKKRKEHVKIVSDLGQTGTLKKESRSGEVKGKKDSRDLKKSKKEVESRQNKSSSMVNPLKHLLTLKSPTSAGDNKKSMKQLNSTGKRRKLEEKQNWDVRNPKKKSKKMVLTQNQ